MAAHVESERTTAPFNVDGVTDRLLRWVAWDMTLVD